MSDLEMQWQKLSEKILAEMSETLGDEAAARKYTDEMIFELRELYKIYKPQLVDWFAGLYEPNILFDFEATEEQKKRYSGGAGFYFSNSARDNYTVIRGGKEYQLLPDAETTAQVFGFIKNSGMVRDYDNDISVAFPPSEQKKIIRFIKALQEEGGNFYHPQWLSMLGTKDFWDSRRARDLGYSLEVLKCLKASPTYDTPSGVKGDGILYDGTKIGISDKKEEAKDGVVSQQKTVHPRLKSIEAFKEYLNTLSLPTNSYFVGNELSALSHEVIIRDEEEGTPDNPRPYSKVLDEYVRSYQNPETGVWHDNEKNPIASIYFPNNGVMKLLAMYNTLKLPFPNPAKAAKSAFTIITADQPINHVCDLYNLWVTVCMIVENLKKYASDADLAKKIIAEVRLAAIPAVRATKEKMQDNLCEDGSFMYHRVFSTATCTPENPKGYGVSQNAPVCTREKPEGGVNATVIFTYGVQNFMFGALNFGSPISIFDKNDLERFKEIISRRAGLL